MAFKYTHVSQWFTANVCSRCLFRDGSVILKWRNNSASDRCQNTAELVHEGSWLTVHRINRFLWECGLGRLWIFFFCCCCFGRWSIPRSIFRSGLKKKISSIFLINNPPGELTHQAGPVCTLLRLLTLPKSVLECFPWRSLQALKQVWRCTKTLEEEGERAHIANSIFLWGFAWEEI